jgi:glycosyltransferase involved in cell wall biosynthesis
MADEDSLPANVNGGSCRLDLVVPCFDEEEVLPETAQRLKVLLEGLIGQQQVSVASRILFVDDGSRDGTWRLIEDFARANPRIRGIKLSRNRGHQNALMAGLFSAHGDVVVSVDADLQDDLAVVPEMLSAYRCGADVVYGVRKDRSSDSLLKRASAQGFYRLMEALGAETVYNHADFRLMSRRAIEALKDFREVNLFLRGIVPLIGFDSAVVYYDRVERCAGESKYPFRKMLSLALNAVTSFSVLPLRLITLVGFAVSLVSFFMAGWTLWIRFFTTQAVPGWASTLLPIYFLGGVQILCIGVIGEYLAKVYQETKARPRYIIDRMI